MIRRMPAYVLLAAGAWLITQFDVLWLSRWPVLVTSLCLLAVIITTLVWGLAPGIWTAAAIGWLQDQMSVLPPSTHLIAFIGTASFVWLMIHRIVATRSLISFLLAVMAGTAAYYVLQVGWVTLWQVVDPSALHPAWQPWLTSIVWQMLIHPLIAYVVWLLFGRNRYAQTTLVRQF